MSTSQAVAQHLPYLRRYARALSGSQTSGDAYVAATLEALMRTFVENRIKPYYLHHGDLAPGTAHLRTTLERGQELMRGLRGRVSGLCQPEYVLDIPAGHGKAPVGPSYLSQPESPQRDSFGEARYRVVDYCGEVHLYPPPQSS